MNKKSKKNKIRTFIKNRIELLEMSVGTGDENI